MGNSVSKEPGFFNIFGSPKATGGSDYDTIVRVHRDIMDLPQNKIDNLVKELKDDISIMLGFDADDIDVNLCVVDDSTGMIVKTVKGDFAETNNALFNTYHLNSQPYSCLINGSYDRFTLGHVNTKILKTLRQAISTFTRTEYLKATKAALKVDVPLCKRIDVLRLIDTTNLAWAKTNRKKVEDDLKRGASTIGQCIALMNDVEIFTKSDNALYYAHYPGIRNILYRNLLTHDDFVDFNSLINDFVCAIDQRIADGLIDANAYEIDPSNWPTKNKTPKHKNIARAIKLGKRDHQAKFVGVLDSIRSLNN